MRLLGGEAGLLVVGRGTPVQSTRSSPGSFAVRTSSARCQANGIDEGVGHVGERDGATKGDAALTSEFHEPGDKGAGLVDFGDFA